MATVGVSLLAVLALTSCLTVAHLPLSYGNEETLATAGEAIHEVLATVRQPHCSVILVLDGSTSATTVFTERDKLVAPWGVGVLEVTVNRHDTNLTQALLSQMVSQARRLRRLSWCVRVVVVSDDPAFLATFAQWSLKGRLLLWSTTLLVVTRLPLQQLQDLKKIIAMTNAMLLLIEDASESLGCSVYVHLPYSPRGSPALRVASWSPRRGLSLTTHLPLFPDKFDKMFHRPKFIVVAEESEPHIGLVRDGNVVSSPLSFIGPMVNVLNIFATTMNFTYSYVRPPDRSWGLKLDDGSWTGMVGMVGRREVDFGLGPYDVTALRAEVVDFTSAVLTQTVRVLGARGRPEVDPWGFLLPLAPLVWAAILVALLVMTGTVFLLSTCSGLKTTTDTSSSDILFIYTRVVLQQDYPVPPDLWWERLVLASWMILTVVLTRSYAGNLMSFLAVRHISQPYLTLRHVMDDPAVTMVWQANTSYVQYFRSMKSGVFLEIAQSEKTRIKYIKSVQYYNILDSLVRQGDHVLVIGDQYGTVLMSRDFSRIGRCDFYISNVGYMPAMSSMIVQQDSPLVALMTHRINLITQAGLYDHWIRTYMPNSTSCAHPPTKIAVNTSLSVHNLWGMFVLLFGGHGVSLLVLGLERLTAGLLQRLHFDHTW